MYITDLNKLISLPNSNFPSWSRSDRVTTSTDCVLMRLDEFDLVKYHQLMTN